MRQPLGASGDLECCAGTEARVAGLNPGAYMTRLLWSATWPGGAGPGQHRRECLCYCWSFSIGQHRPKPHRLEPHRQECLCYLWSVRLRGRRCRT